jgi:hypothetical protein
MQRSLLLGGNQVGPHPRTRARLVHWSREWQGILVQCLGPPKHGYLPAFCFHHCVRTSTSMSTVREPPGTSLSRSPSPHGVAPCPAGMVSAPWDPGGVRRRSGWMAADQHGTVQRWIAGGTGLPGGIPENAENSSDSREKPPNPRHSSAATICTRSTPSPTWRMASLPIVAHLPS